MSKIRLGGIKILEGCTLLTASCNEDWSCLARVCSHLSGDGINMTYLSHIADDGLGNSSTALCTDTVHSYSSYFFMKLDYSEADTIRMHSDMNILSVFPHNQRPHIAGTLMKLFASRGIRPHGFASSPSALSALISAGESTRAIDGLFDTYEFPSYRSPFEWHAAYRGREQLLKEVVCSYKEQIIKVYNVTQQPDLTFWATTLPLGHLGGFGEALIAMDRLEVRVPFLVAQTGADERLVFVFCATGAPCEEIRQVLSSHVPDIRLGQHQPAGAFALVGPHFGDRHGITNALMECLREADILPLAMNCAVSSISVAVRVEDLERVLQALSSRFQIPVDNERCREADRTEPGGDKSTGRR